MRANSTPYHDTLEVSRLRPNQRAIARAITSVVAFAARWKAPLENIKTQPKSGLISFDEWNDYFRNGADFECDALLFDESRPLPAETLGSHCWTLVDTDNGLFIVEGKRLVDRMGYLVTEKPHDGVAYEVDYEERDAIVFDGWSDGWGSCPVNARVCSSHASIIAVRGEGAIRAILRKTENLLDAPPGLPFADDFGSRVVLLVTDGRAMEGHVFGAFGPYVADDAALANVGDAVIDDGDSWLIVTVEPLPKAEQSETVLFERTDRLSRTSYLSDRFGSWIVSYVESNLAQCYSADESAPGDPRNFLRDEMGYVAERRGKVGIQFEYETGLFEGKAVTDPTLRANIEHRSKTVDYACDAATYNAHVRTWMMFASALQARWPEVEVFLADGEDFFDGALTVCAFVPLIQTADFKFTWPSEDDKKTPELLVKALQDTTSVMPADWGVGDAPTAVPPDPEKMNDERARFADNAIKTFVRFGGCDEENSLGDLLCNLMHWADRNNFDFDAALERAQRNYGEETLDGQ